MSWNGSGLPSARSAISSPSNTALRTGSLPSVAATSGSRAVMSSSVRVNSRTSPSATCAWIRMPSSFHSTAARAAAASPLPSPSSPAPAAILARASAMDGALAASIGLSGCPTSRPNPASAWLPPVSAAPATAGSDPRSITARRT